MMSSVATAFSTLLVTLLWVFLFRAAPAAPTALKASTISSTRIDLRWADNSSDETSFRVERCTGSGCTTFAEIGSATSNATSYTDTTASASATYRYRVRARNSSGDSGYATSQFTVTPASGALSVLKLYPATDYVEVGRTKTMTLLAKDAAGNQLKYIYPLCSSSNPSVVSIIPDFTVGLGAPGYDDGRVQTFQGNGEGTATITCALGGVNANSLTVTVKSPAASPSVTIGGDVSGGAAAVKIGQPLEVDLSGSTGAKRISIQWGDGDETTDLLSAAHAYRSAGSKTLTVTVTNSSGAQATATAAVTVSDFTVRTTLTATSVSDLISKYNAATGGEVIQLAPGTYTGTRLVLPAKTWTTGDGWVTIRSSGALPPLEQRINPTSDAAQLVRVQSTTGNAAPVELEDGVNHVRVIGFQAEMSGAQAYALFKVGSGTNASASQQPSNVIFQHCVVANPSNLNYQQGFWNSGRKVSLISSSLTNIFFIGAESHAAWSSTSEGGHVYYNDDLEGAGMPVLYGGSTTYVDGEVPTNIEFRRCYFHKRLSWRNDGTNKAIKNLFELKSARRVYVASSQFSNSYAPAGQYYAIVLKTNAETDDSPWVETEDVVIENSRVSHAVGGFSTNWDLYNQSVCRTPNNLKFKNVLWEDISDATWGDPSSGLHGHFTLLDNSPDTIFQHVTALTPDGNGFHWSEGYGTPRLVIQDSIIGLGYYGIRSDGYAQGVPTLDGACSSQWTVSKNVFIAYGPNISGLSTNPYPGYNDLTDKYPATVSAVGFTDYANGVYSLASGSAYKNYASDGTDPGVNWPVLQDAVSHAVDGVWGALPSPWQSQDVGAVTLAGSSTYSGGTFTVKGSTAASWDGSVDALQYAYQTLNGDGQIVARVTGVQNTSGSATVGLMFRESLSANSAYVRASFNPIIGGVMTDFAARTSTGVNATWIAGGGSYPLPEWLKLVRSGNTFTAYRSDDGANWVLIGSTNVTLSSSLYVGLSVDSANSSALNTTTFDNVAVSAPALPSPWQSQDVGAVTLAGSSTYSGGAFTVKGSTASSWDGSVDALQYVYRTLSGDGQMVARVTGVQNTSGSATVGIMFRESLAANAAHVRVSFNPIIGGVMTDFAARSTAGTNTTWIAGGGSYPLPEWLKLVRSGNTFTAYRSDDGTNWVLIGSTSVTLSSTLYVGMSVDSANSSTLNTTTFDNVTVSP